MEVGSQRRLEARNVSSIHPWLPLWRGLGARSVRDHEAPKSYSVNNLQNLVKDHEMIVRLEAFFRLHITWSVLQRLDQWVNGLMGHQTELFYTQFLQFQFASCWARCFFALIFASSRPTSSCELSGGNYEAP